MTDREANLLEQIASLTRDMAALRADTKLLHAAVRDVRSLVGPFGMPMPDGTVLVQTLYNVKYFIDPTDLIIAPNLIIYRQWEADLSALLAGAATRDTVFVDVGANFGYFTCLLGSAIGRLGKGRVFCFEPNPKMVALLQKNTMVNWSMCPITISNCALADAAGTVRFSIPKDRASNAAIAPIDSGVTADAPNDDSKIQIDVEVSPLDKQIPAQMPVDLMKIDVEGHEAAVLKGASRVIAESGNIRIVMEWSPPQMRDAGYGADAVIDTITHLGLEAHRVPESRRLQDLSGTALTHDQLSGLAYDNIILKRAET